MKDEEVAAGDTKKYSNAREDKIYIFDFILTALRYLICYENNQLTLIK